MFDWKFILKIINLLLGVGIFLLMEESSFVNFSVNSVLGYFLATGVFLLFSYVFSKNEETMIEVIEKKFGKFITIVLGWLYWLVSCLCMISFLNSLNDIFFNFFSNKINYVILVTLFFLLNIVIYFRSFFLSFFLSLFILISFFFILIFNQIFLLVKSKFDLGFLNKIFPIIFKISIIFFCINYIKYIRRPIFDKVITLSKILILLITPIIGGFFLFKNGFNFTKTPISLKDIFSISNKVGFCFLGVELVSIEKTSKNKTLNTIVSLLILSFLQFLNVLVVQVAGSQVDVVATLYNNFGNIFNITWMGTFFLLIKAIVLLGSLIGFSIANKEIGESFQEKKIFNFNFDFLKMSSFITIFFILIFSLEIPMFLSSNVIDNSCYISFLFYMLYFLSNKMNISNLLSIFFCLFLLVINYKIESYFILIGLTVLYPIIWRVNAIK